jgi:hypothetical protein
MFNNIMKDIPSNALQWRKVATDEKPRMFCNIYYKWGKERWVDRSNRLNLCFWYFFGYFWYGLMYIPYKGKSV